MERPEHEHPVRRSTIATIVRLSDVGVRETGVDGAGVAMTSVDGSPVTLHATNDVSADVEELQFTLGEGPCVDASTTGTPVLIADLTDPAEGITGRWPVFREEASRLGVRALFAFPIRIGAIALGTIDLQRAAPGPLNDEQLGRALTMVDAVGDRLLDLGSQAADGHEPTYSMSVHQAAGMVMVQLGITIEEALVRLRATAFADDTALSVLAADIVAGRRRMDKEER